VSVSYTHHTSLCSLFPCARYVQREGENKRGVWGYIYTNNLLKAMGIACFLRLDQRGAILLTRYTHHTLVRRLS
jgi:hypothetical protein